jgi:hypothetical protein
VQHYAYLVSSNLRITPSVGLSKLPMASPRYDTLDTGEVCAVRGVGLSSSQRSRQPVGPSASICRLVLWILPRHREHETSSFMDAATRHGRGIPRFSAGQSKIESLVIMAAGPACLPRVCPWSKHHIIPFTSTLCRAPA